MKFFILFLIHLNLVISGIQAQHLIGLEKSMVIKVVNDEMKGFRLDKSSTNPVYNYLKYFNAAGTKTLVVLLNDKDISTESRLICDYSELSFIREEYNKKHKRISKDQWEYKIGDDIFIVDLEEKEWYFVVLTKKKKSKKWWF
jgi:hypothetical protein